MLRDTEIQNYFPARDGLCSTRLPGCLLVTGIAIRPLVNKLAATLLAHPTTPPDLSLLSTATYAMEQDSILAIIQFHSWNPLQFEANSSSDSSQGLFFKKRGFPAEVKHQWTSQEAKIIKDHSKEEDQGFLREAIQLQKKMAFISAGGSQSKLDLLF